MRGNTEQCLTFSGPAKLRLLQVTSYRNKLKMGVPQRALNVRKKSIKITA